MTKTIYHDDRRHRSCSNKDSFSSFVRAMPRAPAAWRCRFLLLLAGRSGRCLRRLSGDILPAVFDECSVRQKGKLSPVGLGGFHIRVPGGCCYLHYSRPRSVGSLSRTPSSGGYSKSRRRPSPARHGSTRYFLLLCYFGLSFFFEYAVQLYHSRSPGSFLRALLIIELS